MTTLDPRPLLPTFLPSINTLLAALALPFTLDDPTDLTPSLLLAIFESLINARLPIPSSVRQSRTRDAKARAMLVLLGVLECDVLRGGTSSDAEHSIAASNADDSVLGGAGGVSVDGWVDEIGLGEVDPERLADGAWEETIFVGELLCWLARRKGILPRTKSSRRSSHSRLLYSSHHSYGTEGDTADFSTSLLLRPSSSQKSQSPRPSSVDDNLNVITDADCSVLSHITDVPRHPLVHSPEPSLSASATTGTDLSIRARSVSSRTSVSNVHDDPDEFEEASQDTMQMYDPRRMMQDAEEDDDQPPMFRPQCIHELEDPSYIRMLAGPSSSFDLSVSHSRISDHGEDDLSRADNIDGAEEQDINELCAPPTPTPRRVRLSGWIESVDSAAELSQFAASRAHSRSRALNTSASPGSGHPPQRQSNRHLRLSELPRSTSHLPTPCRISLSPSPPPSPSPPLSSPPTSKPPPSRSPSGRPPSPPSPPADSDPPFDVSFSTLNNTSTPAKPRPPKFQTTAMRHAIGVDAVEGAKGGAGSGSGPGMWMGLRPRRRDRSPSYTPSPPSFSTPGSLRSGGSGAGTSPYPGATGSAGPKSRANAFTTSAPPTTAGKKNLGSTSLSPTNVKGKSPLAVSSGSTATTNTLLTERARLLTELAALKRARAASNAGARTTAVTGVATGASGGSNGVVGRRVGVGV